MKLLVNFMFSLLLICKISSAAMQINEPPTEWQPKIAQEDLQRTANNLNVHFVPDLSQLIVQYVQFSHEETQKLYLAISNNDFEMVKKLVSTGNVDVNGKFEDNNNYTALNHAIFMNYYEIVEFLIKNNAKINVLNKIGMSPLHYACELDRQNIVELLCKYGANINQQEENSRGYYPLHFAIRNKNFFLIQYFIEEKKASVLLKNNRNENALDLSKQDAATFYCVHFALHPAQFSARRNAISCWLF